LITKYNWVELPQERTIGSPAARPTDVNTMAPSRLRILNWMEVAMAKPFDVIRCLVAT